MQGDSLFTKKGIPNKSPCYATNWKFTTENIKIIVLYYAQFGPVKVIFSSFFPLIILGLVYKECNTLISKKDICTEIMC